MKISKEPMEILAIQKSGVFSKKKKYKIQKSGVWCNPFDLGHPIKIKL